MITKQGKFWRITYQGETYTLAEFGYKTRIPVTTLGKMLRSGVYNSGEEIYSTYYKKGERKTDPEEGDERTIAGLRGWFLQRYADATHMKWGTIEGIYPRFVQFRTKRGRAVCVDYMTIKLAMTGVGA